MGSSMVHLAVVILLFAVRTPTPVIVPGPDVVQVALVGPAQVQVAATPPAPEPEPVKEVQELPPVEETGVKITPPPKKPTKTETKPSEPAPPAPALPYARVGTAGLSGQVSLDQGDFEFTYYLVLVRNRVAQNWSPPAGLGTGGQPVRAVVYFKIGRGGEISATQIEQSSNAEFFDRSALRSVMISNPMPPLPLGYSGSELGVHFGFEYSGP
jgi:protein TonB